MRNDFLGGTSATGGTGALTLTASRGLALPASGMQPGQMFEYSIVEYTDSTKATVLKGESGFGSISGTTLTRSIPVTTWDGTTYSQVSPAAQNFGTTAANIEIQVTPIGAGGPTAIMRRVDLSASFGTNDPIMPISVADLGDLGTNTLAANTAYFSTVLLSHGFPVTSFGVKIGTGAAGKSLSIALFTQDPATGGPGAKVMGASGLSAATAANVYATVPAQIIPPGWYWFGVVSDGAPAIHGTNQMLPGPMGGVGASSRQWRYMYRSMTYGAFGATANATLTGSWNPVSNLPAPIPLFK